MPFSIADIMIEHQLTFIRKKNDAVGIIANTVTDARLIGCGLVAVVVLCMKWEDIIYTNPSSFSFLQ